MLPRSGELEGSLWPSLGFDTERRYIYLRDVFDKYAQGNNTLGMNELATMFIDISKKMTNLPAVSDRRLSMDEECSELNNLTRTADRASGFTARSVLGQEVQHGGACWT